MRLAAHSARQLALIIAGHETMLASKGADLKLPPRKPMKLAKTLMTPD